MVLYETLISDRVPNRIILSDCSIKIPGNTCSHDLYPNKEYTEYDLVNDLLPEAIEEYVANGGEFIVLDHHGTAVPMLEFYNHVLHDLSILETHDSNNVPRAGSELAYRYYKTVLGPIRDLKQSMAVEWFMEICGDYDCWRNPLGFGGHLGLAQELIKDDMTFIERLTNVIIKFAHDESISLPETAVMADPVLSFYITQAQHKLKGAIDSAKSTMVQYSSNIAAIQISEFSSLVSHAIYEETGGVVLITYSGKPNRFSLRSAPDHPVDLGAFCKRYGGGGHKSSAGAPIPHGKDLNEVLNELIEYVEQTSKSN